MLTHWSYVFLALTHWYMGYQALMCYMSSYLFWQAPVWALWGARYSMAVGRWQQEGRQSPHQYRLWWSLKHNKGKVKVMADSRFASSQWLGANLESAMKVCVIDKHSCQWCLLIGVSWSITVNSMWPTGSNVIWRHRTWLTLLQVIDAWWHQAVTWTNNDLRSIGFYGIYLMWIAIRAHDINL